MAGIERIRFVLFVAMIPVSMACIRGAEVSRNYDAGSPSFCHGIECPAFTVVSTEETYEERLYQPSKWVSTDVLDLEMDAASSKGFRRLFRYIQGENERQERIAMTAPVSTRVIPGAGPACETNFTISFFVAPEEAADAPNPTNTDIYFTEFPSRRVYVRSFGGFADQDDWVQNARELEEALRNDGVSYEDSFYYKAGYDGPFRLWGRHNEVWFLAPVLD